MFVHNCTIYRPNAQGRKRFWLRGVYMESTSGMDMIRPGLKTDNDMTLFIPRGADFLPEPGDYVVKGLVSYDIIESVSELFAIYEVFVITSVDNMNMGNDSKLGHYRASARTMTERR